jgi:phage protein D
MADDELIPLQSARPTVRIDGQQRPVIDAGVIAMRMREAVGGLSSLELKITDWRSHDDGGAGFAFADEATVKLGSAIKVYAGATLEPQEIFDGVATALEIETGPDAAPTFAVLAEDKLQHARKTRRSRVIADVSPADLVRLIASDHRLDADVRDGLDQPVGTWAQMNESDLAFLRRVLDRFDADAQVVGGRLQAGPRARDPRAQVELRLGDGLVRARAIADLADQTAKVRLSAWNPADGEQVEATATAGELGPGAGRAGAGLLSRAFGGEFPEHVGHQGPMRQDEADAVARATFSKRARRFVRVEATAQGDPRLRVGSWITLAGVNPLFAGSFVMVEACHRFDLENGYMTDLVAEGAYLGAPQ